MGRAEIEASCDRRSSAAARGATYDAAPLVFLDNVQLLLDDLVGDVESRSAAVIATVGTKIVRLDLKVTR